MQPDLGGLNILQRLKPISYTWKSNGWRDLGFGAEQVAEVEPLLAFKNEKGEIEGVNYRQISTVLVNAIKEAGTNRTAGTTPSSATKTD